MVRSARGALRLFVLALILVASAGAFASADVSVVKTLDTPGPYVYADELQYTIVVSNAGPDTATNIQVTEDTLNLNVVSVSGACSSFNPCTITSLDAGASETINVTAKIAVAGEFDNSATATADEPDPDSSNNTDDTGNGGFSTHSADLSITETLDTAGPYTPGQSIQYTLVISNAGPSHAINVVVTDTPSNVTITSVSGAGCSSMPCTFFALLSGASTTITVNATIDAAGTFENAVSVTNDRPDPDSGNNSAAAGGEAAAADISVTKTLQSGGPFQPGDSVTYLIQVSNAGPSPATNIQVIDTPSNLTITGVSDGCTSMPCTIALMNPNNTQDIFVTATIDADGDFDNSVTVTASESDPDLSNNTANAGGTTGARADLWIAKSIVTEGPYKQGGTVQFQTVVTNNGPSDATNVVVTDTPIGVTFVSGSVSGGGCTAFPCTIASLANGDSVTITYSATINNPGSFDNSTSVTSDAFDPDSSNNSDPFGNGGVASNAVDVAITKTLNTAGPYAPGQSIQYTLVVSNAGPGVALFVVVNDTPTNLTITSVSGAGCSAFPCTLVPGLTPTPSSNRTITVTATINSAGAFDNAATATVRSSDVDNDPSNNTDDTGNGGTTSADLGVAKSIVTEGPYKQGQTVAFQTVVTNNGPSDATNVVVTDTPIGVTLVSGSISGGGCTAFPCTIPSLANGASVTITYSGTIQNPGAFDNSAGVSADDYDHDTSNNSDLYGNGGVASNAVDVSITKTLITAGPYAPGQSIQYTLVLSNAGPGVALFVVVDDTPTNLTITNVSGAGCSAFPCTIVPGITPTPASNRTITVTATINSAGAFDNVATATVRSSDVENDPSNNTDDTGNGGTTSADLAVAKSITSSGPYKLGGTATFQTVVTNNGPSDATNVVVTDTPVGVSITSGSVSGGGCTAFPCTIPSLASGASATITYSASITTTGSFDNSTTVSADQYDHDTSNNTDPFGNGGVSSNAVDVAITKTLNTAGPYVPGQSVTYTLVLSNAGPGVALFVVVDDTPTNLTITSVSGAGCSAFPCTIVPGITPTPASNRTITVTATINSAGAFDNVATATIRSSDVENDPSNNTDSTGNGGIAVTPNVTVTKAVSAPSPVFGATVTYSIVLTNESPFTLTDNAGNELDDVLPAGLALVSATATTGTAVATTSTNTVTWNGSLGAGSSVTITIDATITAFTGTISNQATAHADLDNNGTNETSVVSNSASFTVTETTADLSLTMDYSPAVVGPSDDVTYTLVVTNSGPLSATNVVVTDDLPNDMNFKSVSSTQGSCTTADPVVCSLGTLANGVSATITLVAKTPSSYTSLTNTATATADQTDPTPASASSSVTCMKTKKGVLQPCH